MGSKCFQIECGSCFIYIFQQGARLEGSESCLKALGHTITHRRRQCQPGKIQQVGR